MSEASATPSPQVDADLHRAMALETNHHVWTLLGQATRSDGENGELVDAAHASLYHWRQVGTNVELQRGEWLISHVYAVLGRVEPALFHAQHCYAITQNEPQGLADFDHAYAYEAMARALALAGDLAAALPYYQQASAAGSAIADDEDRSIFLGDFGGGEWYGLD